MLIILCVMLTNALETVRMRWLTMAIDCQHPASIGLG